MTLEAERFATLITSFFTRHLVAERSASAHTIRSYRDTFRLLLRYVAETTGQQVSRLVLDDLNPDSILSFLEYLEQQRRNSVHTRNARLAAIHSFFSYNLTQDPAVSSLVHRVLAIPFKKTPGRILGYLTQEELTAILDGPDRTTSQGRRDYLALALLYDTGARVQELLDLCPADFRLDRYPLVYITGKGRKQRVVPLTPTTAGLVNHQLSQLERAPTETTPLLTNYRGDKMTRSGITYLVEKYRRLAAARMPTLRRKGISPHTFRHAKAMHMLQADVSPVTIKDILGHAHLKTLEVYIQADLEMKRKALEESNSPVTSPPLQQRHKPDILQWLEQL